jgi:hypothetical protein
VIENSYLASIAIAAWRGEQPKERWFFNHRLSKRGGVAEPHGVDHQSFTKHTISSGAEAVRQAERS